MPKIWERIFTNLKREMLMTLSNIFVMTITFLLLGMFVSVVVVSQTALRYLERQAQVTIFFKDDFVEENILNLKDDLEKDPRISEVEYVSKEDAFRIFTELNKDEPILLESISASILPASLEIKSNDIANFADLATELSGIDGVEEVRFFRDVIDRFRAWSNVVYVVGFAFVAMFLVISYSIIISTLRALIHTKGVELEIMKLVGASNSYVKTPLLFQGMFLGVTSALISSVIIILVGYLVNRWGFFTQGFTLGFLPGVFINPFQFSLLLSLFLLLSGSFLGYLGSYTAVRRYLKY